jgi:anti-sigma regulatory factor (Ser/Thr protein kinase)
MAHGCSEESPTSPIGPETLQIVNRLSELDRLSSWVADLSARWGLSARVSFQLDLVLAEAVTNVIENAYTDGINHKIDVVVDHIPPMLEVQICDDGQPFNPLDYPVVAQPQNLAEATVGGLGIHLIRSYAKECRYERRGQKNWFSIVLNGAES